MSYNFVLFFQKLSEVVSIIGFSVVCKWILSYLTEIWGYCKAVTARIELLEGQFQAV